MSSLPKPSKHTAAEYIAKYLPTYGELLEHIKKADGKVRMPITLHEFLVNFEIRDYAKYYADQEFHSLLADALLKPSGYHKTLVGLDSASQEQQTAFIDSCMTSISQDQTNENFPLILAELPTNPEEAIRQLDSVTGEANKAAFRKNIALYFAFFMVTFHDLLALMGHGHKMSHLVKLALEGDDSALFKALKTDPTVDQFIPYFRDRFNYALQTSNDVFINKYTNALNAPAIGGKIEYPLLYLVFAMLESMNLLDDLTDKEILEICDHAGLDRWQNRIDDVGYLNKRKNAYRKLRRS